MTRGQSRSGDVSPFAAGSRERDQQETVAVKKRLTWNQIWERHEYAGGGSGLIHIPVLYAGSSLFGDRPLLAWRLWGSETRKEGRC